MEQGPARRLALPTVSCAAAGAAGVSLAVVAVPWLRMSVEAPSLRVALETGGALLAATAVGLLLRQCGPRRRADHLWLSVGLCVLAATALTVATLIIAGAWSPAQARYALAGSLAGTVMLAIAAFAPARRLRVPRRWLLLGAGALGTSLFALAAWLAGPNPSASGAAGGRLVVQVLIAVALVIAAAGLARRADRLQEPLLLWIAVAAVVGRVAAGADSVHVGDMLRVAAWLALLAGVVSELRVRLHERAQEAIVRERHRLARELHDGVAQELAFIRRRASRLAETEDGLEIASAAARALEDSRRAIEALVPPAHEPLHVELERLGARLAGECGVEVQVNARAVSKVSDDVRAELIRIISEAVRNAAHHGGARHVRVDLSDAPLKVRVIDDGSGFRDGAKSGLGVAGYGLISMRERAENVGGQFSLESVRGAGTLVQVVLP
jgi:signal transduction histidine kinase